MGKLGWCKASFLLCFFYAVGPIAFAQTFTTVFNFDGTNGTSPNTPIQGMDGSYYGTTIFGGPNAGCGSVGCGTFFRIPPTGALTTLYWFCSQTNCTDGGQPAGVLVLATDGNFYGTTFVGGGSNNCPEGCGTVFRISATGTLTTLHSFDLTDGARPRGALVQATDGRFYGVTN